MEVSIRISPDSDDDNNGTNTTTTTLNTPIQTSNINSSNNNDLSSPTTTTTSINNIYNNNLQTSNIFHELLLAHNSTTNNSSNNNSSNNNNSNFGIFNSFSNHGNTLNSLTSRLSNFNNSLSSLYTNNNNNNSSSIDIISNSNIYNNNINNGDNEDDIENTSATNNLLNLSNNDILPTIDTSTNINNNDINNNNNNNTTTTTTTTTTSTARIDIPMVIKWIDQNSMYLIILFIVFLYLHRQSILVFLWQQAVFIQANYVIKTQVVLQEKRSVEVLLLLVLILTSNIFTTYMFFSNNELWRALVFLVPKVDIDVWGAFWVTILNDFIVRFICMILKALVIMIVGHRPPYRRRSQLYSVIEVTSQLYRTLVPISIWTIYLHTLHREGEHIFGSLMVGLYLTFKLSSIVEKSKFCVSRIRNYFLTEVVYNELCTICQEKMVSPILLRCNHLFCEDCISQWFEHKRTCPLCRTPIRLSVSRTHSDGSTSLLLQIF